MERRIVLFILVLAGFGLVPSVQAQPEPAAHSPVQAVVSLGLTVSDLDRSVEYFTQVLSFDIVSESEIAGEAFERLFGVFGMRARVATLRLGTEQIELMEYLTPQGRPMPTDSRGNDHWFQHIAIVVSDMDRAYEHLRTHKVRHASTAPQTLPSWNANAGGIKAFYFRDPDGHFLELIEFPPGKGDPRWQEKSNRLFLGIDHTAIVVAHTNASLQFWQDAVGLKVVGGSENYGTEQEHLNNVFGARLRITALRAPAGPGVEFLEYLSPSDGRPSPPDTRSHDLWSWYIRVETQETEQLAMGMGAGAAALVSPGTVSISEGEWLDGTWVMARDTDGHALLAGRSGHDGPGHRGGK